MNSVVLQGWAGTRITYRLRGRSPSTPQPRDTIRIPLTAVVKLALRQAVSAAEGDIAFWYQTEPHAKFPKLPDKGHREVN